MIYKIFSTIFLITSASVGGGIIAQPILINKFGVIPNFISLLISLFYTYISSMLIVKLYINSNNKHYFSMFESYVGKRKNFIIITIYLFICLFSLTSYFNGIKNVLISFNIEILKNDFFLFTILFLIILLSKIKTINFINNSLEILLIFFFFLILIKGIKIDNILEINKGNSKNFIYLMPIFITSLSYQIILPNIIEYLNKNERIIKISIISGLFLSIFFFFIWNLIIINNINIKDLEHFQNSSKELELYTFISNKEARITVKLIIILILITSLLGISLGTKDLIKDIVNTNKENLIIFLIVISIIINSKINENKFIDLLEKTSIYGEVFLNGVIPFIIYVKKNKKKYFLLFFMLFLELLIIFFIFNKN